MLSYARLDKVRFSLISEISEIASADIKIETPGLTLFYLVAQQCLTPFIIVGIQ
jgi:hypothetical protein